MVKIGFPFTSSSDNKLIKGIVQPFELRVETKLSRSAVKYGMPGKLKKRVYDTISREEHKTIFRD
jgi:hypothetical protein